MLSNGTTQGCPLSLLLFALCIEPLSVQIHQDMNIHGLLVRGRKFKISLFTDDVYLTLTQPRVTLPNLHKLLDEFWSLLGYKINPSKSEAVPLNLPPSEVQSRSSSFPYAWKFFAIKYLGVYITPSYKTLYNVNFRLLFTSFRTLLAKWKHFHISWLGCIASNKMTILPKISFYNSLHSGPCSPLA